MILNEVDIGKTETSKRIAVSKNLGKQVIVYDFHQGWCHGKLLKERGDLKENSDSFYQMKISDARGQRNFYYHDLSHLLVIE